MLLAPPLAIAGLLYFTIAHPFDSEGVIKATYVQFGCAPLYGLFGLAVESSGAEAGPAGCWPGRPLAGLALVAIYTFVLPDAAPLDHRSAPLRPDLSWAGRSVWRSRGG